MNGAVRWGGRAGGRPAVAAARGGTQRGGPRILERQRARGITGFSAERPRGPDRPVGGRRAAWSRLIRGGRGPADTRPWAAALGHRTRRAHPGPGLWRPRANTRGGGWTTRPVAKGSLELAVKPGRGPARGPGGAWPCRRNGTDGPRLARRRAAVLAGTRPVPSRGLYLWRSLAGLFAAGGEGSRAAVGVPGGNQAGFRRSPPWRPVGRLPGRGQGGRPAGRGHRHGAEGGWPSPCCSADLRRKPAGFVAEGEFGNLGRRTKPGPRWTCGETARCYLGPPARNLRTRARRSARAPQPVVTGWPKVESMRARPLVRAGRSRPRRALTVAGELRGPKI